MWVKLKLHSHPLVAIKSHRGSKKMTCTDLSLAEARLCWLEWVSPTERGAGSGLIGDSRISRLGSNQWVGCTQLGLG